MLMREAFRFLPHIQLVAVGHLHVLHVNEFQLLFQQDGI